MSTPSSSATTAAAAGAVARIDLAAALYNETGRRDLLASGANDAVLTTLIPGHTKVSGEAMEIGVRILVDRVNAGLRDFESGAIGDDDAAMAALVADIATLEALLADSAAALASPEATRVCIAARGRLPATARVSAEDSTSSLLLQETMAQVLVRAYWDFAGRPMKVPNLSQRTRWFCWDSMLPEHWYAEWTQHRVVWRRHAAAMHVAQALIHRRTLGADDDAVQGATPAWLSFMNRLAIAIKMRLFFERHVPLPPGASIEVDAAFGAPDGVASGAEDHPSGKWVERPLVAHDAACVAELQRLLTLRVADDTTGASVNECAQAIYGTMCHVGALAHAESRTELSVVHEDGPAGLYNSMVGDDFKVRNAMKATVFEAAVFNPIAAAGTTAAAHPPPPDHYLDALMLRQFGLIIANLAGKAGAAINTVYTDARMYSLFHRFYLVDLWRLQSLALLPHVFAATRSLSPVSPRVVHLGRNEWAVWCGPPRADAAFQAHAVLGTPLTRAHVQRPRQWVRCRSMLHALCEWIARVAEGRPNARLDVGATLDSFAIVDFVRAAIRTQSS